MEVKSEFDEGPDAKFLLAATWKLFFEGLEVFLEIESCFSLSIKVGSLSNSFISDPCSHGKILIAKSFSTRPKFLKNLLIMLALNVPSEFKLVEGFSSEFSFAFLNSVSDVSY